jgi:hypothetical protein
MASRATSYVAGRRIGRQRHATELIAAITSLNGSGAMPLSEQTTSVVRKSRTWPGHQIATLYD